MIEPRRLYEESNSDLERALLNAGATYRCSPSARMKTLAALGLAGSAALSASAVGVSTTSLLAKLSWPKALLTVTAIGAVTAVPLGYYVWHRHNVNAQLADAVAPAIIAKSDGPVRAALQSDISNVPVAEQPAVAVAELGTDAKVAPLPKVEPKLETSASALSEELNALDSVRSLLAQGDATGALSRLDVYNKSFPRGSLQLEAEVLRIDALMKSGQTDLAKKRAQAFLNKHPNSVLASRVRGLL